MDFERHATLFSAQGSLVVNPNAQGEGKGNWQSFVSNAEAR